MLCATLGGTLARVDRSVRSVVSLKSRPRSSLVSICRISVAVPARVAELGLTPRLTRFEPPIIRPGLRSSTFEEQTVSHFRPDTRRASLMVARGNRRQARPLTPRWSYLVGNANRTSSNWLQGLPRGSLRLATLSIRLETRQRAGSVHPPPRALPDYRQEPAPAPMARKGPCLYGTPQSVRAFPSRTVFRRPRLNSWLSQLRL